MEGEEAGEFTDGFLVVVDAEVDVAIVVSAWTAFGADDEESGALLAALIAAGRLGGFEGADHPLGEFALTRGASFLEGGGHGGNDRLARKEVSLDGIVFADLVAGPRVAIAASVGGDTAHGIDHRDLAHGGTVIGLAELGESFWSGFAGRDQREAVRAIGHFREGLGGDGTDTGSGPGDNAAHPEVFALDSDTEVASGGVVSNNGEGVDERRVGVG